MNHRLNQVEQDAEASLHMASRIGSQFARSQLRIVPSKRSTFASFSEEWQKLRAAVSAWPEI
eukprot:12668347-Prorocentrum_lima.AAC.1